METFQAKLQKSIEKINSLLTIGLDPHITLLHRRFLEENEPLFEFCKWIVDQTHEFTAVYKIQFAYFEALGSSGYKQLEKTIQYIKAHYPNHLIIADAKRGDIADTSEAYATSIFDYLNCDAVTLHPYLGEEALQPFLKRADKGSIILCRTSNLGAGEVQDLIVEGNPSTVEKQAVSLYAQYDTARMKSLHTVSNRAPLWEYVAHKVTTAWNRNNNCLLVVGATYPQELERIREIVGDMWLLVPGIGAQGGDLKQVMLAGLTQDKQGLLISASRSIIFSSNPHEEAKKLRDEINKYRKNYKT